VANTIDSFLGNSATSVATGRTAHKERDAASSAAAPAATAPTGGEEVQITSTAAQLARLGQQLGGEPAFDAAKVARISQSLADGTYTVSPTSIASGLLQSERSLAQLGM